MKLTALALVAAALVAVPSSEAKSRMSITVRPAPVWAKQPARVVLHTEAVLPRKHGLQLGVVGAWHARYGNVFFEPLLRRTGPKTYSATVRFPRGGVWSLVVPNWGGRVLRVRPAP
jgi:hypothetical protein